MFVRWYPFQRFQILAETHNIIILSWCGAHQECRVQALCVLSSLPGFNVDKARRLLKESGLTFTAADDFEDVARKAVAHLPPS